MCLTTATRGCLQVNVLNLSQSKRFGFRHLKQQQNLSSFFVVVVGFRNLQVNMLITYIICRIFGDRDLEQEMG
jgi:hypothetical protein